MPSQSRGPGVLRAMAATHLRTYRDAFTDKQAATQDPGLDNYCLDAAGQSSSMPAETGQLKEIPSYS